MVENINFENLYKTTAVGLSVVFSGWETKGIRRKLTCLT